MFNLQACYSINDILFSVSLFTMILTVIVTFTYLMVTLIKDAVFEVQDMKSKKDRAINTR